MDPLHRQGLVTATACWLAILAALAAQLSDPWWAAISAWVVAQPDRDALLRKGLLRIGGTVAGAGLGYTLGREFGGHALPEALAIFIVVVVGTWGRFTSAYSYAWLLGTATAMLVATSGFVSPVDLYATAHYRAYEIVLGVLAAMLVGGLAAAPGAPASPPAVPAGVIAGPTVAAASLVTGLTILAVLLVWSFFDLPSLAQIIISVLVVVDRDIAALRVRGVQRLLGCLVGGGGGILLAGFGLESFPLWSAVLWTGLFALAHLHHGGGPWAYAGTQGGVGFILALVTGPGPPDSIVPALDRLAGMLTGVALIILCSFLAERLWHGPAARG